MEWATAVVWVVVGHWPSIDDCSVRAIAVGSVAAVGLTNGFPAGMIVGTMVLADAMAVAFAHGIAGNLCNVDDDSNVGFGRPRVLHRQLAPYPNDAMELESVLAVVHGTSGRWAMGSSKCAVPMRSVGLAGRKRF